MDITIAGLHLVGDNDDIHQPLEAVVCLKGLDEEGNVCYWSRSTEGLTTVEARGMAITLLDDLRELIMCECKCHSWKPRKWALCLPCGDWRHPDLHDVSSCGSEEICTTLVVAVARKYA